MQTITLFELLQHATYLKKAEQNAGKLRCPGAVSHDTAGSDCSSTRFRDIRVIAEHSAATDHEQQVLENAVGFSGSQLHGQSSRGGGGGGSHSGLYGLFAHSPWKVT